MSTDSYWPTVVKCLQQPFRVQDEVKNTDPLDFIILCLSFLCLLINQTLCRISFSERKKLVSST